MNTQFTGSIKDFQSLDESLTRSFSKAQDRRRRRRRDTFTVHVVGGFHFSAFTRYTHPHTHTHLW